MPRALANARLAAAATRAWRVDDGDEDEMGGGGGGGCGAASAAVTTAADDAVAVAALLGESPGVRAPRRTTRANIGAGGAVTIRIPGSGATDSGQPVDVESALASLALATRASELAEKAAAKENAMENAVAGSNLAGENKKGIPPSEDLGALASVLANHRSRTASSFATDAFAAAADASALARHRNSPCDAIRRASRELFALVLGRAVPPHLAAPPSPTAFDFEPATLLSPDGALPLVVAAAARLANPEGVHPRLRDVAAPALVALLRAPRATHVADAASLLSEGVRRDGWIAAMDRHARERLHDDAFHLADALAADATGGGFGIGASGGAKSPRSPKRPKGGGGGIPGIRTVADPKLPSAAAVAPAAPSASSPFASPPPPPRPSSPTSPRHRVGAPPHRYAGTPADLMSARQAVSGLLSALARASPAGYAARLARRLRVARADSPAHAVALFALARVASEHPEALEPHLDAVVDTALREALNPANAALRRSCAAAATAVASEIGARSSAAAFHRESAKLVVAVVGARRAGPSRPCSISRRRRGGVRWRTRTRRRWSPVWRLSGNRWRTRSGSEAVEAEAEEEEEEGEEEEEEGEEGEEGEEAPSSTEEAASRRVRGDPSGTRVRRRDRRRDRRWTSPCRTEHAGTGVRGGVRGGGDGDAVEEHAPGVAHRRRGGGSRRGVWIRERILRLAAKFHRRVARGLCVARGLRAAAESRPRRRARVRSRGEPRRGVPRPKIVRVRVDVVVDVATVFGLLANRNRRRVFAHDSVRALRGVHGRGRRQGRGREGRGRRRRRGVVAVDGIEHRHPPKRRHLHVLRGQLSGSSAARVRGSSVASGG